MAAHKGKLPPVGDLKEVLSADFVYSVGDLLRDPGTPDELKVTLIHLIYENPEIFLEVLN